MTQSRVLILTTNFPNYPGHGSGAIVFEQARGLVRMGWQVTVLAPSGPGLRDEEMMDGLRVVRFRYAPDSWQKIAYGGGIPANLAENPSLWFLVPGFMASFASGVRKLAKNADLIHAHWSPAGVAASLGGRGLPLILNYHGSDIMKKSPMIRALAKAAARQADAIVVPGENLARYAREVGIREDRITVVHHGVDTSSIIPGETTEPPEVVYLGRLSEEKAPDLLLRAYSNIPSGLSKLVIIGAGPMEPALREEAARFLPEGVTEFTGALSHRDALDRMSRAAVYVMPSRREGFPVACLEAMAAGRPIVAARCGGAEDMIDHEKTGLLVPVDDAPALSAAIKRLLRDRSLAARLGDAARAMAVKSFDRALMVDNLDRVYRRVLAGENRVEN